MENGVISSTSLASPSCTSHADSVLNGGGEDGGEDRISSLADALLSSIVSCLPPKDAARTTVLSLRWRNIWTSIPLILNDSDLLQDLPNNGGTNWRAITSTISGALNMHPGPFHSVHLSHTCNFAMSQDNGAVLCSWLSVLAEKDVWNLILINSRSTTYADLPTHILRIGSLMGLYLNLWRFPRTDSLMRGMDVFPNLVELRFCRSYIRTIDLDRLLHYSPKIKTLVFIFSNNSPATILIRSLSLRCLVFWRSVAHELEVHIAPNLERLILSSDLPCARPSDDFRIMVNIGSTRLIKVIGYLNPAIHVLKIFETVIKVGTMPSRGTILPSVSVLAVKVRLGVPEEAKMLLSYLRCFPNVETLHIMSDEVDEPNGKIDFSFWKEAGPITCMRSKILRLVFKNFRGGCSDLAFLRFVWERSKLLQKMELVLADGIDQALVQEVLIKLNSLVCVKQAIEDRKSMILVRSGCGPWSWGMASDLSIYDPFDF